MPRKGPAPKRPVVADPVYGSPIVSQLVNKILLDGKKDLAQRIVYDALEDVADQVRPGRRRHPQEGARQRAPHPRGAIRRVGGSTYQVPVEVKPHRANTLALRWLTSYAKARREKTMTERLTNEILDASNGLGAAVKRREDTHKMAESNSAFAHYRW